MAIGIEPQTMPEARLPREVFIGHTLQVVGEPVVGFSQLPEDIRERSVSLLLSHLRIEGIDAAIPGVSWWPASGEDQR